MPRGRPPLGDAPMPSAIRARKYRLENPEAYRKSQRDFRIRRGLANPKYVQRLKESAELYCSIFGYVLVPVDPAAAQT